MRPNTSLNQSPFQLQLLPAPQPSPKGAPASLTRDPATTMVSAQGSTVALQLGQGSMQAQGSMLELELGQGSTAALGNSMQ